MRTVDRSYQILTALRFRRHRDRGPKWYKIAHYRTAPGVLVHAIVGGGGAEPPLETVLVQTVVPTSELSQVV